MKKKVLAVVFCLAVVFANCAFAGEISSRTFSGVRQEPRQEEKTQQQNNAPIRNTSVNNDVEQPTNNASSASEIESAVQKSVSYNPQEVARFVFDYFKGINKAVDEYSMSPVSEFVEGDGLNETKNIVKSLHATNGSSGSKSHLIPFEIISMKYNSSTRTIEAVVWGVSKWIEYPRYIKDVFYWCQISPTQPYKIIRISSYSNTDKHRRFNYAGASKLKTVRSAPLCLNPDSNSKIIELRCNAEFQATKRETVGGKDWIWGRALDHNGGNIVCWGWIPAEYLAKDGL